MTRKIVHVVAGVLVDDQQRILLCERPVGKPMAGLWEFAGGKLELGESPEAALVRELKEELDIALEEKDCDVLTFVSHAYEAFHLIMYVYVVRRWQGEIVPQEGQRVAWVSADHLADYPMPAADVPLIPLLQAAVIKLS